MLHHRLQSSLTGLAGAIALIVVTAFARPGAQTANMPNPYHEVAAWAKLPAGVSWGGVISVDPAPNGDIWVFHRSDPTILRFDQSGKVVKSFGAGTASLQIQFRRQSAADARQGRYRRRR